MCNRYEPSSRDIVRATLNGLQLDFDLPEFEALKPIGPRGRGLFLRPADDSLKGQLGVWGMIRHKSPPPKKGEKVYNTNNARVESIATKQTFAYAWRQSQRCLIPATSYDEPNWQTGSNIWWRLRRTDGQPWFIAGLWDEWLNTDTGEIVPNYTMITCNCTGHPFLGRLHKEELDPETKKPLLPEQQDKRSLIHVDAADWDQWLHGSHEEAMALIKPQASEVFDQADAVRTDQLLASQREPGSLF